jgi:hypothetical protein
MGMIITIRKVGYPIKLAYAHLQEAVQTPLLPPFRKTNILSFGSKSSVFFEIDVSLTSGSCPQITTPTFSIKNILPPVKIKNPVFPSFFVIAEKSVSFIPV